MLRFASGVVVVLAIATVSFATPVLSYDRADLGGGLYGFTFHIHESDGKSEAYACSLGWKGVGTATIQQVKAFGAVVVDKESDATSYDGLGSPPYAKTLDTWYYDTSTTWVGIPGTNPWDGTVMTGVVQGANDWIMSMGTGALSTYGDGTLVAYIVVNGEVEWKGTISREAGPTSQIGQTPEPATMSLLVLGGLGMLLKRKRS